MPKKTVNRRQLFTLENFEIAEEGDDGDWTVVGKAKEKEKPKEVSKKDQKQIDESITKRCSEMTKNAFTRFYTPNYQIRESELEDLSVIQLNLKSYQHSDAIDFSAATWKWMKNVDATCYVKKPRGNEPLGTLPTYSTLSGCRAYYRVVWESESRYILMTCHENVHGKTRGDLRFVEITDQTETRGIDYSPIGVLFLGDIVAVTELVKTEHFDASFKPPNAKDVVFDGKMKCQWAVRKMSILPRNIKQNQQFAVMENGRAVVNGHGDAMNVKIDKSIILDKDTVYVGDVFIPEKMESNFTSDHHSDNLNRLIQMCSDIPSVPYSQGTIYEYLVSNKFTEMFDTGTDAFKNPKTVSNASETLEFCALIGYSAARAVFSAHDDYRKHIARNPKRDGNLVRFSIDNSPEDPTDGFWHSNGRIRFSARNLNNGGKIGASRKMGGVNAMIETLICEGKSLKITARLSRDAPDCLNFDADVFSVQQREPFESSLISSGFFSLLDEHSNGKRIIRTLYGGPKMTGFSGKLTKNQYVFPSEPPIQLNEFQCEYVQRVLEGTPIVIANSPFGCGKSMTIVTAGLYLFEEHKKGGWSGGKPQQLLITQSNYASVNLVDIAMKTSNTVKDVKFLRYVSENNWKEMPDACRTDWDMPKLMNDIFVKWATNQDEKIKFPALKSTIMVQIVSYCLKTLGISTCRLNPMALGVMGEAMRLRAPWPRQLHEAFFLLYHPDIIIVTASSLPGLLSSPYISNRHITNIQIDEASQLAEYTLLSLLTLLPDARFGLIGDIQQLPPYCEEELTGKLKDYGIGNAMERAVKECMFPQVILKCVYRCHPSTTALLGQLFYNNDLISGIKETQRSEFMRNHPNFWPNPKFPIMVVDNKSAAQPMGTSFANQTERLIVKQIIDFFIDTDRKKYLISPTDIGVISYYSAQTALLTDALRDIGVKCGTVDSFQGSEREIIVLCCTNDDIQEFMQVKNRLNVAMSRSKQVTILIGNVEMLKKVEYWGTIIERCEENGCVVDTNKHPFKVMPPGNHPTNKSTHTSYKSSNHEKGPRKNENVSKLADELKDMVSMQSKKHQNKKKHSKK